MADDQGKAKPPRTRAPSTKTKSKASSKRAIEKLTSAGFLSDEAPTGDEITFVHAVLCQIGLPRSPTRERVWERSNGAVSLRLDAGAALIAQGKWEPQPLPQGPYARLMLADISTYAVRYRTRIVPMEASVSAYMRERLRLLVTGGVRGTYSGFRREALALTSMRMSLGIAYDDGRLKNFDGKPIDEFEAWTIGDDGARTPLWPSELVLSERFFRSLQTQAAPIKMNAYKALSHSALAQDIYTWLAHRLPRLKGPLALSWPVLAEQFGGYSTVKRFREEFIKRLREVLSQYRDARVSVLPGKRGELAGKFELRPSAPPVPRSSSVVPIAIGTPDRPESRSEIRALLQNLDPD